MTLDGFKAWLEEGGAKAVKARNSRANAIKAIERKLQELGMPFRDLESAWKEDCFESLRERLRQMQEDSRNGGQDYRILFPESENPKNMLSNYRRWLGQYGRFLDGEPPGLEKDADRIRAFVVERYIEPAREKGDPQVEVHVGKVHSALNLSKQWTNVYQSLKGDKFSMLAQVPKPEQIGKDGSTATVFRFDLRSNGINPENLIFHGPPGTGKTYSTTRKAVELCREELPEGREELRRIYNRLVETGRIEFVTFHQSMSYEDFVEGRQPMTESDEGDETTSAGFRLETIPGIFRRIAKRAETSRGRSTAGEQIAVAGRKVFKMSIGEANNPEDAHLFEEAINGGHTLLGWEDIDWSDDKYADRQEVIEAHKANGIEDLNAASGAVQMPFIFRNWVSKGDFVIVSKGNLLFRAIGQFTGDYEYYPRPEGGYAHRRAVRWLWVDRQGVPVSEIYTRRFSMKAIYILYDEELNIPALERYLNSQQDNGSSVPESFVLIIDEINRANISKVFGELITLLEPDKRLGQPNEVKVRLPYSGDEFGVPSNLHILGTMNTADRSIALMDTALRRRFEFRELMPDSSLLVEAAKQSGIDLPRILDKINERIEYLYDREHQIGHAYFINCKSKEDVHAVMRHKVIPLLAEYFFEDWGKVATVLGDVASHDKEIKGGFLNRFILKAPPGLEEGDDRTRFRWEVRSEKEKFDYGQLTEA